MKIGELALSAKTQPETIRFYEREGLLPQPPRSDSNYRIYGPAHLDRLAFIRHCRTLDMTLDEIRLLLRFNDAPNEACDGVNVLLDEHIQHVVERIQALRQLEQQLKALRALCDGHGQTEHCGILSGLAQAAGAPAASRPRTRAHVAASHGRVGGSSTGRQ